MDNLTPLTTKERNALHYLLGFDDSVKKSNVLEQRLKSVPGLWQQYRTALSCIDKVTTKIIDTIPTKQLKDLHHFLKNAHSEVKLKSVSPTPDYVHVRKETIAEILTMICEEKCQYCLNQGKEIENCKLRKTLDSFGIDVEDHNTLCKYAVASFTKE